VLAGEGRRNPVGSRNRIDGEAGEKLVFCKRVEWIGLLTRLNTNLMESLDIFLIFCGLVLAGIFIYNIIGYIVGLKGSPRELYLVYIAKVVEYTAYGSMIITIPLFLSSDVGMSDMEAGTYFSVWSMAITIVVMLVGPIADTFGIKRTLMLGTLLLLLSRMLMPLTTNIYILSVVAFLPLAIGIAMKGPVLTVAIKRFTTKESAALGFGLFYVLMNVGFALGAWLFDFIRGALGETTMHKVLDFTVLNKHVLFTMSTYRVIFCVALVCSLINTVLIYLMREGVEMDDETQAVVITPPPPLGEGNKVIALLKLMEKAGIEAVELMGKVFKEKSFWIFLGMLSTLICVKMVFYHFNITFPKYGIRVLGEGMKIGSIFGVLNPVMIIFLTPLIAILTRKMKSYPVLLFGTFLSSAAIFIAVIPDHFFEPMMTNWVGEIIFDKWLGVPEDMRQPTFISLVFMVVVFTVGEAIWSPRLMQFTAEIAPKGREGSYIALAALPYFGAKFAAGPFSGWLLETFVPEGAKSYPEHYMVWVWIGGTAMITPILLVVLRKVFLRYSAQT